MERTAAERKKRLDALVREDEIFTAYERSARELEGRFDEIAASLGAQDREVLVGYAECLKLMQLRLGTVTCEHMEFTD